MSATGSRSVRVQPLLEDAPLEYAAVDYPDGPEMRPPWGDDSQQQADGGEEDGGDNAREAFAIKPIYSSVSVDDPGTLTMGLMRRASTEQRTSSRASINGSNDGRIYGQQTPRTVCCGSGLVIVPSSSNRLYSAWECFILVVLFFCCYLVPLDVMVFAVRGSGMLDVPNFCIDVAFMTDIVLNFFKAYKVQSSLEGTRWEEDKLKIARRYLAIPLSDNGQAGWFWIDVLATGPRVLQWASVTQKRPGVRALALFRSLRLLRFLHLHRTDRLAQYVLRIHVTLGFSLNVLEIVKFIIVVTIVCHLMACSWVSIEGVHVKGIIYTLFEFDYEKSWLSELVDGSSDPCVPSASENVFCVYTLALYWSVITMTSVGFGDICPTNFLEYLMCSASVCIVALVWAYVIATIVGIVTNMNSSVMAFNQEMDDINELCKMRKVPQWLQVQIRDYMACSSHVPRQLAQVTMLQQRLSKGLKDKIWEVTRGGFLEQVWWAKDLPRAAKLEIIDRMVPRFYGIRENIVLRKAMFFLREGRIAVNNRTYLANGDVYGEINILIETESLIQDQLKTETYVDAVTLKQESLREVCAMFPAVDARVRRAQVRCAVWRGFVRAAYARRSQDWWMLVARAEKPRSSFADAAAYDRQDLSLVATGKRLSAAVQSQERMAEQLVRIRQKVRELNGGAKPTADKSKRMSLSGRLSGRS